MSIQILLVACAVSWSAFYFLRGAYQDLKTGTACSHCSSGGCPAAGSQSPRAHSGRSGTWPSSADWMAVRIASRSRGSRPPMGR